MESGKISLTINQVGDYLRAQSTTVNRWVKEKKLKAYRTDEGEQRVLLRNIYDFVRKHGFPVNGKLPKVSKS